MNLNGQSIAADWHEIDLGELATFRTGPFGSTFHKSDYIVGGTPLINPSHIIDGDIVPDETVTVQPELAKRLSVFALREGEIVIGRRGDMGRCAVVKRRHVGFLCGTGSMIVRPRPGVNPHLLQALLSSPGIIAKIEENSVGTTMINLNQGTLASLNIRMASEPEEQEAIAEALSDADALIEGLERLIAKKRLIKQGAMQDLLTAKRRLPGFSGEWETKRLAEIGQVKTGLTYSPTNVSPYGTLVLRSSNIQQDRLAFDNNVFVNLDVSDEATVRAGDLLICVRNGSRQLIGKTAIIDDRADGMAFGAFMSAYRSDLNAYLIWCFQSSVIQKQVAEHLGATINQITNKTLKGIEVPIPVDPEERHAISTVLTDMDAEIQALETRLEKARQVKEGMMQNLLTGRIRLV